MGRRRDGGASAPIRPPSTHFCAGPCHCRVALPIWLKKTRSYLPLGHFWGTKPWGCLSSPASAEASDHPQSSLVLPSRHPALGCKYFPPLSAPRASNPCTDDQTPKGRLRSPFGTTRPTQTTNPRPLPHERRPQLAGDTCEVSGPLCGHRQRSVSLTRSWQARTPRGSSSARLCASWPRMPPRSSRPARGASRCNVLRRLPVLSAHVWRHQPRPCRGWGVYRW